MQCSGDPLVSIIVLSFDRPDAIKRQVAELEALTFPSLEIIVVDNNSSTPVTEVIGNQARTTVIRLEQNIGVGGRNEGIRNASGSYLITLDDDVFGLNDNAIRSILYLFENEPIVGAVNFKVVDDETEKQINWCHHRKIEDWGHKRFETYEISEGAVAFKKDALSCSGLYPESFFISHEGPDLALRLMDCDYSVIYSPDIKVRHAHAVEGRPSWRRYYYDTRNSIWLALRCYPATVAARKLPLSLLALLVYSIRDGYFYFWLKAIRDGIGSGRKIYEQRTQFNKRTWNRYKSIEKENASLVYMVKKRFFKKGVSI